MDRFVKTVSLLTISLFLLSASIDATLDRLETAPARSQLAIYSPAGRMLALYHGNVAQLQSAGAVNPSKLPLFLHRGKTTGVIGETGWL